MKKKLISLLLLICMAISSFILVACEPAADDDPDNLNPDDSQIDEHTATTLTLWIPTDESTTRDSIALVEEALNKITQAKYNSAIKLYAVPEDEYETAVNEYMSNIKAEKEREAEEAAKRREEARKNKNNGVETEKTEETTPAETTSANSTNKYSVATTATAGYPSVDKNQMDIFLIRGYDQFNKYVSDNMLEALDEELAAGSKMIKSYVYPTFLNSAKVYGQTFAIPNNHPIGEYQYLLLNKEIVDAENVDWSRLITLDRFISSGFLNTVSSKYPGMTPLYGEFEPTGYQFWSSDPDADFSVLASRVLSDTAMEEVPFRNIFSYNDYINTVCNIKSLRESGYLSDDSTPSNFGAGIISGTPADIEQYEDEYYVNVLSSPVATLDDVFQAAFGVSVYTKDVGRSMEIITLLNTDPEFRTILQYGVEGTHWKTNINNSKVIDIIRDDYKMDLINTGNVYMTYPDAGVSMEYWEKSKEQNLDSYMPITLQFTQYVTDDNKAMMEELATISADYKARIDAMSSEELRNSAASLSAELSNMDLIKRLSYIPVENDKSNYDPTQSVAYLWQEYYLENLADPQA